MLAAARAARSGFFGSGEVLGGWGRPVAGTRQVATEHGLRGVSSQRGRGGGGSAGRPARAAEVPLMPPGRTFFLEGFP